MKINSHYRRQISTAPQGRRASSPSISRHVHVTAQAGQLAARFVVEGGVYDTYTPGADHSGDGKLERIALHGIFASTAQGRLIPLNAPPSLRKPSLSGAVVEAFDSVTGSVFLNVGRRVPGYFDLGEIFEHVQSALGASRWPDAGEVGAILRSGKVFDGACETQHLGPGHVNLQLRPVFDADTIELGVIGGAPSSPGLLVVDFQPKPGVEMQTATIAIDLSLRGTLPLASASALAQSLYNALRRSQGLPVLEF